MAQPPQFIGKGLDANPQNRINKPKGAISRKTKLRRALRELYLAGRGDMIIEIYKTMTLKAADKGDVNAANLVLDAMYGKQIDKAKIKHSGNMSLVDLVEASIKKEQEDIK